MSDPFQPSEQTENEHEAKSPRSKQRRGPNRRTYSVYMPLIPEEHLQYPMDAPGKEAQHIRQDSPSEASAEAQGAKEGQLYGPPLDGFSLSFVPRHMRTRTVEQARHQRVASESGFLLSPTETPEFPQGGFGTVLNTVDPTLVTGRKSVDESIHRQPQEPETALPMSDSRSNIDTPVTDKAMTRPSSAPRLQTRRHSSRALNAPQAHSSPPPVTMSRTNVLSQQAVVNAPSDQEPRDALSLPSSHDFEGNLDKIGQSSQFRSHKRHNTRSGRHSRTHSHSQSHHEPGRPYSATTAPGSAAGSTNTGGIRKTPHEHRHSTHELPDLVPQSGTTGQSGPAPTQLYLGSGPGPPSWAYDESPMGENIYSTRHRNQPLGLGIAMTPRQPAVQPPPRMYYREPVSAPRPALMPVQDPDTVTSSAPGPGPSSTRRVPGGPTLREDYSPYDFYPWPTQKEAPAPLTAHTSQVGQSIQQQIEQEKVMSPPRITTMNPTGHQVTETTVATNEEDIADGTLMMVPGDDYDGPVDTDWTIQDEEELFKLLDTAERFKWKYISDQLSEQRMKRIPARACHLKFQALFGETESMSALKSSLFYVAYRSGWKAIKSEHTQLEYASSTDNAEIRHELSSSPNETNGSSAESASDQAV